jgi:hypothetical protein
MEMRPDMMEKTTVFPLVKTEPWTTSWPWNIYFWNSVSMLKFNTDISEKFLEKKNHKSFQQSNQLHSHTYTYQLSCSEQLIFKFHISVVGKVGWTLLNKCSHAFLTIILQEIKEIRTLQLFICEKCYIILSVTYCGLSLFDPSFKIQTTVNASIPTSACNLQHRYAEHDCLIM